MKKTYYIKPPLVELESTAGVLDPIPSEPNGETRETAFLSWRHAKAVIQNKPGCTLYVVKGTYIVYFPYYSSASGINLSNIHGTENDYITIKAEAERQVTFVIPSSKPMSTDPFFEGTSLRADGQFHGGCKGMHIIDCSYLNIEGFVFTGDKDHAMELTLPTWLYTGGANPVNLSNYIKSLQDPYRRVDPCQLSAPILWTINNYLNFSGGLLHVEGTSPTSSHNINIRRCVAQKPRKSGEQIRQPIMTTIPHTNPNLVRASARYKRVHPFDPHYPCEKENYEYKTGGGDTFIPTPNFNVHCIYIQGSSHVLVEECEAYHFHRHGISANASNNVTFRRNYANSNPTKFNSVQDYYRVYSNRPPRLLPITQPFGFSFYPTEDSIMENNISENNFLGFMLKGGKPSDSLGSVSNNRLLGNISLTDHRGLSCGREQAVVKDVTIENQLIVKPLCSGMSISAVSGLKISNLTIFANLDSSCDGTLYQTHGLINLDRGDIVGDCSATIKNVLIVRDPPALAITDPANPPPSRPGFEIKGYPTHNISNSISYGSNGALLDGVSLDDPNEGAPPSQRVGVKDGEHMVYVPSGNPKLYQQGEPDPRYFTADIGANVTCCYEEGKLVPKPLWTNNRSYRWGSFRGGLDIVRMGSRCKTVHERLHIGHTYDAIDNPDYEVPVCNPPIMIIPPPRNSGTPEKKSVDIPSTLKTPKRSFSTSSNPQFFLPFLQKSLPRFTQQPISATAELKSTRPGQDTTSISRFNFFYRPGNSTSLARSIKSLIPLTRLVK